MSLNFRWLGAAGLEIRLGDDILLIDPFFSRPGLWSMLLGGGRRPNPALAARYTPRADHVLVTHAHYDHLLDVPIVMQQTGAAAAGPANACALLAQLGLPPARLDALTIGDRRRVGPWDVEVGPNWHTRSLIDFQINGALRKGLPTSPHLLDYRMDACYSYRLSAGGQTPRLLVGGGPCGPVDVAFVLPYLPAARLRALLAEAHPRLLVPIHWDDFFRPLERPLRPIPLKRPDPAAFARRVQAIAPNVSVLIPEIFREYPLQ